MLGLVRASAIPGVEDVSGGTYRRTVVIDGDPGVLELSPGGPDHLVLRAHLPHWAGLVHVARRARRIFNLDADIEAADRDLGEDPLVGGLVTARPGIRPPGCWDPFEAGIAVIVAGHAAPDGARASMRRLVGRHGRYVPGLGALGLTHAFPSPAELASADLSGLGLGASGISTIRGLARVATGHTLDLDRPDRLETLIESLTAVPGISADTAHRLALRFGERDAFPAASSALLRALSQATGRCVTPEQAQAMASRWRPWRAHAAVHLCLSRR
jgi:AraC family transcriptional regulator, regulatory protein of adaptative response / DNA-3-methyladenine glycosylase II